MSQNFQPGDFLVFQLEAGFALLRLLAVDDEVDEKTWHLAAYDDYYLDVDMAEAAIDSGQALSMSRSHLALSTRAFESTQVAKIANIPLNEAEIAPLEEWRKDPGRKVSDKSIRLLLGLR
ncbi:MAG TPA: hypothetical protein PLL77_05225 [Pyrinomonadaceae bacterium]|nr:hypothetical protein [Pyrinomonadaceae bacterium]